MNRAICLFLVVASATETVRAHRFRNASQQRQRQIESQFDFLILNNVFYDCPKPQVLDGQKMGIVSLDGAKQACVDNPSCKYFLFNQETSEEYLCSDSKGYESSTPHMGWTMGVKPSTLEIPSYSLTLNQQAICDNPITQSVPSLDEAAQVASELQADFFTMNLNKAGIVGPNIGSMTAYFCNGPKRELKRDGFVIVDKSPSSGPPASARTIQAPCGLNGSIQPDTSKMEANILPGEIVSPSTS